MKINESWLEILPSMISSCQRNGCVRNDEFESYIIQSAAHAGEYAYRVIRGPWKEAEDTISSSPEASLNYSRNVIRGRWEKGEDAIATNPFCSFQYARYVIRGKFEKGEESIATDLGCSMNYAKEILKGRFILGEPIIANHEVNTGDEDLVENYYKLVIKSPEDWASWTPDQLKRSPCWMYMYAKEYSKGRLPDFLHNNMNVFAMTIPNNYWVKRYFKAKKYSKKIKHRKKPEVNNQGTI